MAPGAILAVLEGIDAAAAGLDGAGAVGLNPPPVMAPGAILAVLEGIDAAAASLVADAEPELCRSAAAACIDISSRSLPAILCCIAGVGADATAAGA